jgi:hypothetical protein
MIRKAEQFALRLHRLTGRVIADWEHARLIDPDGFLGTTIGSLADRASRDASETRRYLGGLSSLYVASAGLPESPHTPRTRAFRRFRQFCDSEEFMVYDNMPVTTAFRHGQIP